MELTVKHLLKGLVGMLENGTIKETDKVIIAHHTTGPEGLLEDLYFWGLDYIYESNEDADLDEIARKKCLVIEAYNEPIR